MSTLADIDTALAALSAQLTQLSTDFNAAVAALQAKIGTGQDTSKEVAAIAGLASQVSAIDAAAQAIVNPPAPAPAPAPTTGS